MPMITKLIRQIGGSKGFTFNREENKMYNIELGKRVKIEVEFKQKKQMEKEKNEQN